ncbi:NUDIX domain-containing protein [Solibacillus sp. A46]|uniref:NUDIX domain-containing protein n=1 Tax=Solibacillus faecavium TaxID=2762221 RepID=A0ABR8Y071_9BACL|nr:NUDIX domain-containing protein [Solibacillus faecavium]MBD8037589.1 NUDIX domain-containing protein [Solibacillus faecavium]
MTELLKIFDKNYKEIGFKHREIIHERGYWHEVFHCWVIEKINAEWHIYFQLRSKYKKDYPGQYDITAAGHLLSTETVEDGVRELEEEIGINAKFPQLKSLGVIPYSIENELIKDNEFANIFVFELIGGFEQFSIQREEVDGMYRAKWEHFMQLAQGEVKEIEVIGFRYENDVKFFEMKSINLKQMSTLPQMYLSELISRLKNFLEAS